MALLVARVLLQWDSESLLVACVLLHRFQARPCEVACSACRVQRMPCAGDAQGIRCAGAQALHETVRGKSKAWRVPVHRSRVLRGHGVTMPVHRSQVSLLDPVHARGVHAQDVRLDAGLQIRCERACEACPMQVNTG